MKIFFLLIIGYLGVVGFFYINQSSYIFIPNEGPNGITKDCSYIDTFIKKDINGTSLYIKNNNFEKTIIYYHGNTGTVCHLSDILEHYTFTDYNLIVVEYSSFEDINIEPSLSSIKKDIVNVIAWVKEKGFNEVIVAGYSIGTGSASYHVYKDSANVNKIILVSPFTSLVDVVKETHWYLPVSLILKHNFENELWLKDSNTPILIISGISDEVIKHSLSETLANSLNKDNVIHIKINGANHKTIRNNPIKIKSIREFIRGILIESTLLGL